MKKLVLSIALVGAANVAVAATTSTSATVAPNAAAVGTVLPSSTTSVSAAAVGAKPKKWSATAYASAVVTEKQKNSENTSKGIGDFYAQAAKDIGKVHSIAVRMNWLRNQTTGDKDQEIYAWDPYVLWTASNFYGSTLRTNAPTSKFSREIGRHELRHDIGFDLAKFGKFTLSYAQTARAYAYTGNKDGQRSVRWQGDLGLSYKANEVVTPFVTLRDETHWRHSGVGVGYDLKPTDDNPLNLDADYTMEIGAGITPIKGVSIEPSINHSRNFRSDEAIKLFSREATSYELEVSVTM